MDITPIDILHVQFKQGLRGYRKAEVDDFMQRLASTLESSVQQCAELRDKVGKMEAEVRHCRELETTMNNALILAQKTADELKASAHREAELVIREAEQTSSQALAAAREELAGVKAEMRILRELRDKFEAELRALIRNCGDWLDKQPAIATHTTEAGS